MPPSLTYHLGALAAIAGLTQHIALDAGSGAEGKRDEMSDRFEILRLIEDGTLSADEGLSIIESIDEAERQVRQAEREAIAAEAEAGAVATTFGQQGRRMARLAEAWMAGPPGPPRGPRQRARAFRVKVTNDGGSNVNVVLPIGLVDAGLRIVQAVAPDFLKDHGGIRAAIVHAEPGTIVEVNEDGQQVKISIE